MASLFPATGNALKVPSVMTTTKSSLGWTILKSLVIVLATGSCCCAFGQHPAISIVADKTPGPPVVHGLDKLTEALRAKNVSYERVGSVPEARGKWILLTGLASGDGAAAQTLKAGNRAVPQVPEALTIWPTSRQETPMWVIGGFDDRGLMYGLLDVADRIGWAADRAAPLSEVKAVTEQPDVKERGVRLYTMNRAYWESRFYDEAYWTRYLDLLARDRFNSLVIAFGYENGGFLAPCYPYFVDVEGFPEVRMVGLTRQQQQHNLAAFNTLIKMVHDRGIAVTAGIQGHMYSGGLQAGGIPGLSAAPGQPVDGQVSGVTIANLAPYTRAALAKFLKAVPKLDGVMLFINNETGLKDSQLLDFAAVFFQVMRASAPDKKLYVHSKGFTDAMIQKAADAGVGVTISPKYWMEQMGMPFHPTHINRENQFDRRHGYANLLRYPQTYQICWRLWSSGTTRILLWGDPDYARRFVASTHLYDGDGFDVNEPLATKMASQPQDAKPFDLLNPRYRYYDYEFERYWHFFQVFGRLGYNPDTSPEVWKREFEQRFGAKAAPLVEAALHQASWVLPRIVASCYPYACFPTTRGWPEKQRLGDLPQYAKAEGSDIAQFASFDEEAQMLITGGETAKIRPSSTSRWLEQTSTDINQLVAQAETAVGDKRNKEFDSTITDLKILSNLALYHSRRIPAAVSYCLFQRTKDVAALDAAIAYEREAIEAWRQIVAAAGDVYALDLMMGVRASQFGGINHHLSGHWRDELAYMESGLAALEKQRLAFKAAAPVQPAPHYRAVSREDYETKFQIIHVPVTTAPLGEPLKISATVSTPACVKWVRLRCRSVNQEQDYQTLPMTATGEKDTYQAVVPAGQLIPRWDFMYYIEVMDNHGHGRIYPDLNQATPYFIVKLVR